MLFILQAKKFPKKNHEKFFWFKNYLYIYISEIMNEINQNLETKINRYRLKI